MSDEIPDSPYGMWDQFHKETAGAPPIEDENGLRSYITSMMFTLKHAREMTALVEVELNDGGVQRVYHTDVLALQHAVQTGTINNVVVGYVEDEGLPAMYMRYTQFIYPVDTVFAITIRANGFAAPEE